MATHKLLLLPGDGIGPEVMGEVKRLIDWINAAGLAHFETEQGLVGSPELLKGCPPTAAPTDLSTIPSLDFGLPQDEHIWRLEHADGRTAEVHHQPRLITDDLAALRAAALEGVGVAQMPTLMVANDIAAGRLIDVLPHWRPHNEIVYAVFPSRRGLLPSIRALLDHLSDGCRPHRP